MHCRPNANANTCLSHIDNKSTCNFQVARCTIRSASKYIWGWAKPEEKEEGEIPGGKYEKNVPKMRKKNQPNKQTNGHTYAEIVTIGLILTYYMF